MASTTKKLIQMNYKYIELQECKAGSRGHRQVSRRSSRRIMFDLTPCQHSGVRSHVPAVQRSEGREPHTEEIIFATCLEQKLAWRVQKTDGAPVCLEPDG